MKIIIFEHLDTLLTIIVTIIGFVVTSLLTNKNFRNEIAKEKIARNIEAIQTLPYNICTLISEIESGKINMKKYKDLTMKIFAYGSKDATEIVVYIQRSSYEFDGKGANWSLMAALSILITQIKYDSTSEIISPERWFQFKITDYDEVMKKTMVKTINSIIIELNLNKNFLVKT